MKRWEAIIKRFSEDRKIVGAEIGVFKGKNSKQLLDALPFLELHMIDRWSEYTDSEKSGDAGAFISQFSALQWKHICRIARRKVAQFGDRAKVFKMESANASTMYPNGFFDFVFIDGDHSYSGCKKDIKLWFKKIKKGGYICGHDYTRAGVKKAVDEFFSGYEIEFDFDKTWFVRVP
jgi:hypothetical protein